MHHNCAYTVMPEEPLSYPLDLFCLPPRCCLRSLFASRIPTTHQNPLLVERPSPLLPPPHPHRHRQTFEKGAHHSSFNCHNLIQRWFPPLLLTQLLSHLYAHLHQKLLCQAVSHHLWFFLRIRLRVWRLFLRFF